LAKDSFENNPKKSSLFKLKAPILVLEGILKRTYQNEKIKQKAKLAKVLRHNSKKSKIDSFKKHYH